jgi:hypothetical protein
MFVLEVVWIVYLVHLSIAFVTFAFLSDASMAPNDCSGGHPGSGGVWAA